MRSDNGDTGVPTAAGPDPLLRAVLATVDDVVAVFTVEPGPRFRCVAASRSALAVAGLTSDSVAGRPAEDVLGRAGADFLADHAEDALAAPAPLAYEGEVTLRGQAAPSRVTLAAAGPDRVLLVSHSTTGDRVEQRWRTLVRNASDVVVVVSPDGTLLWAGPAAERLLGYDVAAMVGTNVFDLVHADDLEQALTSWGGTTSSPGTKVPLQLRLLDAGGSWRWVEVVATNALDDPAVAGVVLNIRDVTERRAAELMLTGQLQVLERVARGAALTDTLDELRQVAERVFEGVRCTVLLQTPGGLAVAAGARPGSPPRTEGFPWPAAAEAVASGEVVQHLDGTTSTWAVPVRSPGPGPSVGVLLLTPPVSIRMSGAERHQADVLAHLAAVAIDRARAAEALAHQATHDALTGLPNRVLFRDRLDLSLRRARRRPAEPAVLFLDLDQFKEVNDRLGHDAGDELLVELAERLRQAVRPGDTVARFGGDEFAVLCEDLPEGFDVGSLARRLLDAVAAPFSLARGRATVSASIGIALATEAELDADGLIRRADMAMYSVKGRGRAGYATYRKGAS